MTSPLLLLLFSMEVVAVVSIDEVVVATADTFCPACNTGLGERLESMSV